MAAVNISNYMYIHIKICILIDVTFIKSIFRQPKSKFSGIYTMNQLE